MLITASQITSLLQALGLSQALTKPVGDILGSASATLDSLGSTLGSTLDGLTGSLPLPLPKLAPLLGGILEADDPSAPAGSGAPSDPGSPPSFNSFVAQKQSCDVEPYDPPPVLAQTFPAFDQAKANVFRYRQQQGVNLGSWFVHEQWMTPSVFTCASGPQTAEIDIATGWGNSTGARAVLERHWDTFINQSDFEYLASIGINTVRLPIGYWSLGSLYCQGTPFESVADVYTNAWSRVVRAINWAGEAGIGVLVDLHGAPGSQNGQPHSGISDGQVHLFGNATNLQKTVDVLTFLTQQLASVTNVIGIELINEPNDDPSLAGFYSSTISTLRTISAEAAMLPIYIHDGFNIDQYSGYNSKRTDFVVEDHHSYFVFDDADTSRDAAQDTANVEGGVADQLSGASAKEHRNLIVGEWSCALVADALKDQPDAMVARQQFCEGQQQVYANTTAGWTFWSYMKEGCDGDLDWCFKNAVNRTLPATFFSYGPDAYSSEESKMAVVRAVTEMELPSMSEVLQQAGGSIQECTGDQCPLQATRAVRKRALGASQHRFSSIYSRRSHHSQLARQRRDTATSPVDLTAEERAITKGYSDGFLTAKIFAQYGMSRLGFDGQYIADSIRALGPTVIAPGTETYYSDWFGRGLSDAEAVVRAAGK